MTVKTKEQLMAYFTERSGCNARDMYDVIDTIFSVVTEVAIEVAPVGHYVATTGDNGAVGDYAHPWATLAYAATQLVAGDTLYIRGGTYHETVNFAADGTSGNPILISNYPGETVIIDGEYTLPNSGYYSFLVNVSGDYTTLNGVTIKRSQGALAIVSGLRSSFTYITGQGSTESGLIAMGSYNTIDHCTMTDNGNGYGIAGQTTWGAAIGTIGDHTTISHCISHDNTGEGLNAYSTGSYVTIEDCIAYNNLSYQCYIDSTDHVLVQRNFIYNETAVVDPKTGIAIGNESSNAMTDITVINNIVTACRINFLIDSDGLAAITNLIVSNNTFVNSRTTAAIEGAGYTMGVYIKTVDFTTSVFQNNIVVEEAVARTPITVLTADAGLVFSYNCWSKASDVDAREANDITADPVLTKAGSYNLPTYYKLGATSPVINEGVAHASVTVDYWETTRVTTPDMGAHEYA